MILLNCYKLFFIIILLNGANCISKHPIIMLVGFDGFRYDYLNRGLTPILEEFANSGVKTGYLKNIFTTKTFTNFFAIGTGLYAETHGVLSNSVFNERRKCLSYGYEMFHYNELVTPMWTLNEKTGGGRHSGCMMWPGCDYAYQNVTPTFLQVHNKSITWPDRVDTVITWLTHPKTPINLLNMKFERPDLESHIYGPDSPQTNNQLRHVNSILEYMFKKLSEINLLDHVNLMIISDHGFMEIKVNEYINVPGILSSETYIQCGKSPGLQISPNPGYENEVYKNLTEAAKRLGTFTVYKPCEVPDKWHYKNNKLNIGYFLLAKDSYTFQDNKMQKGNHGYPPETKEMRGFFAAKGPLFREKFYLDSVRNIDIYPLVSYLLKLDLSLLHVKTNGTLTHMLNMVKSNENESQFKFTRARDTHLTSSNLELNFLRLLFLLIIVIMINYYYYYKKTKQKKLLLSY